MCFSPCRKRLVRIEPSPNRFKDDPEILDKPPVARHEHVDGEAQRQFCLMPVVGVMNDGPNGRQPEGFVFLVVIRALIAVSAFMFAPA